MITKLISGTILENITAIPKPRDRALILFSFVRVVAKNIL
jgi:hypothetical protein